MKRKSFLVVSLVLVFALSFSSVFADAGAWVRCGKHHHPEVVSMAQLAFNGHFYNVRPASEPGYSLVDVNLKAFYLEKMGFTGTGWIESIQYNGVSNPDSFWGGDTYVAGAYNDFNGNGKVDKNETSKITLKLRTAEVNKALNGGESIRFKAKIKSQVRFTGGYQMIMPSTVWMSLTGIDEPIYINN